MFDVESDTDKVSGDDDGEDWSLPAAEISTTKDAACFSRNPSSCTVSDTEKRTAGCPESRTGHRRAIIHFDIDCFYAQVEMIRNPKLRDVPLGIKQKYSLATSNYLAREKGVTKMMSVAEAIKKCPELVIVNGEDLTHYREMSYTISDFMLKYTPNVERLGFDENFLDVTEMVDQRLQSGTGGLEVEGHQYLPTDSENEMPVECQCGCYQQLAVGSQIAADIRSALYSELGVTSCAGVAHNKVLAKLVGSQHKPNQQTTLFPWHAVHFIRHLDSPHKIPGIGWATWGRLQTLDIVSVTDLQNFSFPLLEKELGVSMATTVHELSFGVDDSPVVKYSRPQTISEEESFQKCSTEGDAEAAVMKLIDSLLPRLVEDGRTPHTLRLSVRKDCEEKWNRRESRQCPLPSNIFTKLRAGFAETARDRLASIAMALFKKLVDTKQPFHLRVINVAFTNLVEPASNSISAFLSSSSSFSQPACISTQSDFETGQTPPGQYIGQPDRDQTTEKNVDSGTALLHHSTSTFPTVSAHSHTKYASKRKSTELLSVFDAKHQRTAKEVSFAGESCIQNSHMTLDCCPLTSGLPPEVDPEVFAHLPPEIQQEIMGHCGPGFSPAIKNRDESKSPRSVLKSSPAKTSAARLLSIRSFFSPSKCTEKKLSDENGDKSAGSFENSSAAVVCRQASLDEGRTDVSDELKIAQEILSCRLPLDHPPCERGSDAEAGEAVVTFPEKSPRPAGHSSNTVSLKGPTSTSDQQDKTRESDQRGLSKTRDCSVSRLPRGMMSVPPGIAPDVFTSLPKSIQREVVADVALRRHSAATTSSVEVYNFQVPGRKTKEKSCPGRSNSLLNYLRRK